MTKDEIHIAMLRRHRRAWGLYLQGWSQRKIAEHFKVTQSRVKEMLDKYSRITGGRLQQGKLIEGDNWQSVYDWSPRAKDCRVVRR